MRHVCDVAAQAFDGVNAMVQKQTDCVQMGAGIFEGAYMKMLWRCRCGKRVEKLTDDNFGGCGCPDPVYGPEYFYMTTDCADMLDEMDKDYSDQAKQLAEARAEIDELTLMATNASMEPARRLIQKNKELHAVIEQMREALRLADDLIDEYAAVCEHADNVDELRDEIKAALSAAERGE